MFDHPKLANPDFHTTLVSWFDGGLHFFKPVPEGKDGWELLDLYFFTYIVIAFMALVLALIWQKRGSFKASRRGVFDAFIMAVVGGAFGARLGEVIFYHPQYFIENPRMIVEGTSGYSVHGAIMGVMLAFFVWSGWAKLPRRHVFDQLGIVLAAGTMIGRLTNFYIGELPGKPASADLPWAVRYTLDGPPLHPVTLYQALGDGLLLLIVLTVIRCKAKNVGTLMASTMIGYGLSRTILEFFREPDAGIDYPLFGLTVGQLLSLTLAICGAITLWYNRRHPLPIAAIGTNQGSGVRGQGSARLPS
ncbi:MAG: prolipoprotein diacylglyceryl transferase [Planctomycetaceae bacterium]|nr:prolipoprotein diacylglyceryl transferase [Planctomycetaceae bacterium]